MNLPGLVALGLAMLYAIGALAKTADIGGAGFGTPTVLQFTPIQQLLALGVSNVASGESVAGITVIVLFVGVSAWAWEHMEIKRTKAIADYQISDQQIRARHRWAASVATERGERLALPRRNWNDRLRAVAWFLSGPVILILFAGMILTFRPLPIFVGLVVVPLAFASSQRIPIRPVFRIVAVFSVTLVVDMTAHAFIYPAPLPDAIVRTSAGVVTGDLLVSTDAATTIGLSNCHIVTIPALQIRSITLSAASNPPAPRTLGDIILGLDRHAAHRHAGAC